MVRQILDIDLCEEAKKMVRNNTLHPNSPEARLERLDLLSLLELLG